MKNYEEIICPKLKEKKQKQKLDRQAAKTEKVWDTPTQKEIKTTNNFDIFKQMMDQEEQAEAAREAVRLEEEEAEQKRLAEQAEAAREAVRLMEE